MNETDPGRGLIRALKWTLVIVGACLLAFALYAVAYLWITDTKLVAKCGGSEQQRSEVRRRAQALQSGIGGAVHATYYGGVRIVCDANGDCHHEGPDDPDPYGFCYETCSTYNIGFFCYPPTLCLNGLGLFPGAACRYCYSTCTDTEYCDGSLLGG